MHVLRTIFHLLTLCGCWKPSMPSPLKKFAYTIYYCYVFLLIYVATFCQFMDLILNVETEEEFCDNFYLTLAMIISCHKMYSMLIGNKNIIVMSNMLESEPFQPETEEETEIRNTCDRESRSNAIYYGILVELTVLTLSFGGLFKAEGQKLPYRIWLPYNYTSLTAHTCIYVQQVLSMVIGAIVHVAVDSLIWGFLMYTYSQIEIFRCRLKKIKQNESKMVKLCVRYHDLIYRFAMMLNEEIKMVIFVQFTVSTLVICINFYILTIMEITTERVLQIIMYNSCMLTQIYIFCWYGNEIKLKSLDISNTIFELDWTLFDRTTKHDLLMIMMRSKFPIEMTSAHVVSMNLESFVALLKTSYSAYNLLHRSQE